MFLGHGHDVFLMVLQSVEDGKVHGIPLSSGCLCPKDESANPVLYPAMHYISAAHFMNKCPGFS